MRMRFETPEQKRREGELAERVAEHYGCTQQPLITETGLPCLLVIQTSDDVVAKANFLRAEEDQLVLHGPSPPRDEFDLEPCRVLPWEAFGELPVEAVA